MTAGPVEPLDAVTLPRDLAHVVYETLKFYADVCTYRAHTEFWDSMTMRPPPTTIPTPHGLTDPAQRALDAWNRRAAPEPRATITEAQAREEFLKHLLVWTTGDIDKITFEDVWLACARASGWVKP